ncbi:putative Ig domain-containing protein [Agromyces aerolatus]|uniref:putative Ig domain-containing protein n=1 Tax=Agromyces sp. LY-1074 TaxID=3074080 RepID=UPI002863722E|nr:MULTISPECIES: putative Ig domain-containing protein [unclassified Agromyces]MDR5700078.1 hypothetical protein [Agromyces sp. LY-1074]MDR5706554.1 hypothetical protein [Agromyces sp. LY-1358]
MQVRRGIRFLLGAVLAGTAMAGFGVSAAGPALALEQSVLENPATDAPSCFSGQTIGQQITPSAEIDGWYLTEYGFTIQSAAAVDAQLVVKLWGTDGRSVVIHTEPAHFPAAPEPTLVTLPLATDVGVTSGQMLSLEFAFDGECPVRFAPGGEYDGGSLLLAGSPVASASMAFRLTFSDESANGLAPYRAPTLAGSPPSGTVGAAYTYSLEVGGSLNPVVSVQLGHVPTGLMLSEGGLLSGTPTEANSFLAVLQASDGLNTALLEVAIDIEAAPPPGEEPGPYVPPGLSGDPSTAPATLGVAYSYQLTLVGSSDPRIEVQDFTVPGLQMDGTGLISGTPTQAGRFVDTVHVTDGTETNARDVIVVVNAPPASPPEATPPVVAPGAPAPPQPAVVRVPASAVVRTMPATGADPGAAIVVAATALLLGGALAGASALGRPRGATRRRPG